MSEDILDDYPRKILHAPDWKPASTNHLHDSLWALLAQFILGLRHITDLYYSCSNQLPPCLLQTIHRAHPSCRLHVNSFRLRSLWDSALDSHEMSQAILPCFSSVKRYCVVELRDGRRDFNDAVTEDMVRYASPNL